MNLVFGFFSSTIRYFYRSCCFFVCFISTNFNSKHVALQKVLTWSFISILIKFKFRNNIIFSGWSRKWLRLKMYYPKREIMHLRHKNYGSTECSTIQLCVGRVFKICRFNLPKCINFNLNILSDFEEVNVNKLHVFKISQTQHTQQ